MIVEGYASTSDMDSIRDIVAPAAFDRTIAKKGLGGPKGIKFLFAHDSQKPLGRITKLQKRNAGLWIEADIDERISYGADIAAATESNGGFSFSIGYRLVDVDVILGPDGREALHLLEVELREVSVVVFPCNDEAVMTFAGTKREPMQQISADLAQLKALFTPSTTEDRLAEQVRQLSNILRN